MRNTQKAIELKSTARRMKMRMMASFRFIVEIVVPQWLEWRCGDVESEVEARGVGCQLVSWNSLSRWMNYRGCSRAMSSAMGRIEILRVSVQRRSLDVQRLWMLEAKVVMMFVSAKGCRFS